MTELSGPQKAAILLLHLDEETATTVFEDLSTPEMKQIAVATREVQGLSQHEVDACLREFVDSIHGMNVELRAGAAFVNKIATKSLGAAKARQFFGDAASGLNDTLSNLDGATIASLVKKEHPQTVALILAHLTPDRGAEVVGQLPEELRPEVIQRLAKINQITPEIVGLVEDALHTELAKMGSGSTQKVGGVNLVADILNNLEKSTEQSLMSELQEQDEELADEVRNLMFVFDDLIFVDGGGIQTLLKEVERDTLVLALKAAGDDLKDHIFKNLSSRAAEMIADDMDQRGPVRLSQVEKAQSDVVHVALRLAQDGVIEVDKSGGDDLV